MTKDISKRTVNILLVIFIITIIAQIFFTVNNPFLLTGKASSTANISVTILSPPSPPSPPLPTIGRSVGGTICYPVWECEEWSECSLEGIQTRTCIDKTGCLQPHKETRTCILPKCTDKIQNQDETDIDCGGQFCNPCEDSKKCKLDTDCVNKCNTTLGICYTPAPPIPPIVIKPAPVSLWQRVKSSVWSFIRYVISKWIFIMPIIAAVLFVYLSKLPVIKGTLKSTKKRKT